MSYCRWSSDDFRCDMYTYEDVAGGWTTHVASNRHVLDEAQIPPPIALTKDNVEAWFARHNAVSKLIDNAKLEPIGGPHDGETFNDPTAGEAAERLLLLRAAGYRVPQYAIDCLVAEESDAEPPPPETKPTAAVQPQGDSRDEVSDATEPIS